MSNYKTLIANNFIKGLVKTSGGLVALGFCGLSYKLFFSIKTYLNTEKDDTFNLTLEPIRDFHFEEEIENKYTKVLDVLCN